jgi:thioredoxin-dependent peroxiredoxin
MADSRTVNMRGNAMPLEGSAVSAGGAAPDFRLTGIDMKPVTLAETSGVRIFSIVPSLDTPVCDAQTRRFNEEAAKLDGVTIYTVSRDLPFAQKRWCGAAGIDRVVTLSDYRDGSFGRAWGVMLEPLQIHCRAVFVVGSDNSVVYAHYCPEVTEHPDYEAAVAAASAAK